MEQGNAMTAAVAVGVFLLTVAALWAAQPWWYVVPLIGFVILVPFVFFMIGEY